MSGREQVKGVDHLDDELLSRLVDDDVSREERRLTEAHLATCVACAARLDALQSTVTLLRGLPSPTPARSFQLAQAHARPASGWRRFIAWLPAGMPALRAAVVAIVLVVGGAAAFAAIQDDEDLGGRSTGIVQSEPTVEGFGGDAAATLLPTVPDAMMEQAQVRTPLPTATPARDAIFGIDAEESSDAASDAMPASTATTAGEVDESSDEVSSDAAASDNNGAAPAAEAPQNVEADEAASESSAAFAVATPTATVSPSPTRRRTEAASISLASPVASPVSSPVASPVSSPSARFNPIGGDTTDDMSSRWIDEMLALAILLMAGGIVIAVSATRGVSR